MKIYQINPNDLVRKKYDSADELAQEMASSLSRIKVLTLCIKYGWWAEWIVTPEVGPVANCSIGYDGDFTQEDIINSLKKLDLSVTPHTRVEGYYHVRNKFSM